MDTDRKLEVKVRDTPAPSESGRPGYPRLRPTDNHLYFDAVARHGSIRKAADVLHIASSALNRRMLDLEEEVGAPLFERLPRGVRPTAAGEMLLGYVRWSLRELRKLEVQLDQLRGQTRGRVRIAVAESVTPSLLPDAIAFYQQEHPGVGFHVIVDGPELLLDALAEDEVDLILTHQRPEKHSISVLAMAEHPLCAFVAPGHPLTRRQPVQLSDCASYPLALPDHTLAARELIDTAAEESSLALVPALESDSIETLKWFARLGEAVCLSFHLGSRRELHGLVALELHGPCCSDASLFLATRRGRVLPVAAAAFAEQLGQRLSERPVIRPVSCA